MSGTPFEPILHSVSYAGAWHGQARLTIEAFLVKASSLGYSGVMLMAKRPHLSVLDYDADDLKRVRALLDRLSLRCPVLAGYTNFSADAEHPEVPQREIQIAHVTDLARMAQALGASVVRVFTAYEHPRLGHAALLPVLADTLRECAKRASDFGVTIGVQNHHDCGVHYATLLDLLEEVNEPNCKACFDAWAPALQGEDYVNAARIMAPYTCHTTVADYQLRPRYRYDNTLVNYESQTPYVQAVPMGDGFIDYRGFFDALRGGGYAGGVAYEMCSPLKGGGAEPNLDRYAGRFIEFMGEFMGEFMSKP